MRLRENTELEAILQDNIEVLKEEFYERIPLFARFGTLLPVHRLLNLIIPFEIQYRKQVEDLFHRRGLDRDIQVPIELKRLVIAVRALNNFIYEKTDFVITIRSGLVQLHDAFDIAVCCGGRKLWDSDYMNLVHIDELEQYINLVKVAREYKGDQVSVTLIETKTQFRKLLVDMINDSDFMVHSHVGMHAWAFEGWSHL